VLSGEFIFGVQGRKYVSRGTFEYHIDGNGTLTVKERSALNSELPYFLPRYGLTLALSAPAEEIHYFGYGPAECYEDKCSHALLGHYTYTPDDPAEVYEYPQERGSHLGTRTLELKCGVATLHISSDSPFSFAVSQFDVHDVFAAKHHKDLKKQEGAFVSLDYRMSGVGSASCGGQPPLESCRINAGECFDRSFTVRIE
jgi:beta-galactosidase